MRKIHALAISLSLVLAMFGCASQQPPLAVPQTPMSTSPDELAVWAAALKEQMPFLTKAGSVIVVKGVTSIHELCIFDETPEDVQNWVSSQITESQLPAEMFQSFLAKNSQLTWVSSQLKDRVPMVLLSPSETREFTSAGFDGWKSFDLTYPHALGIVTISRVAFDTERKFALVCISKQDGMLHGEQSLHVFTKVAGEWIAGVVTREGTRTFNAQGSAMRVYDRNITSAKNDEKRKKKENRQ